MATKNSKKEPKRKLSCDFAVRKEILKALNDSENGIVTLDVNEDNGTWEIFERLVRSVIGGVLARHGESFKGCAVHADAEAKDGTILTQGGLLVDVSTSGESIFRIFVRAYKNRHDGTWDVREATYLWDVVLPHDGTYFKVSGVRGDTLKEAAMNARPHYTGPATIKTARVYDRYVDGDTGRYVQF